MITNRLIFTVTIANSKVWLGVHVETDESLAIPEDVEISKNWLKYLTEWVANITEQMQKFIVASGGELEK